MSVVRLAPGQVGARLRFDRQRQVAAAQAAIRLAAQRAASYLARISPVFDGLFKSSWQVQPRLRGADVVNSAPYAGIIERGARPHGVSMEGRMALAEWVKRKLHVSDERQVNAIVWGICEQIRSAGVKGHWLVRDNLQLFTGWLQDEFDRQLKRVS